MVGDAGGQFSLLHGVDPKAVVPVASTDQVLVVRGQDKQVWLDSNVLSEGTPYILPTRPIC